MTVEERRQVVDQMNGDGQVEGELSRSSGQRRLAQAKERQYGVCGKTGHNARTCQIVVAMSEEEYSK